MILIDDMIKIYVIKMKYQNAVLVLNYGPFLIFIFYSIYLLTFSSGLKKSIKMIDSCTYFSLLPPIYELYIDWTVFKFGRPRSGRRFYVYRL